MSDASITPEIRVKCVKGVGFPGMWEDGVVYRTHKGKVLGVHRPRGMSNQQYFLITSLKRLLRLGPEHYIKVWVYPDGTQVEELP